VRFRGHASKLPGRPDFSNKTRRWALFVHGCFWHTHAGCPRASKPKSNITYWARKLRRNQERDAQTSGELKKLGYRILVLWECELKSGKYTSRMTHFFKMQTLKTRAGTRTISTHQRHPKSK
jgi:DNA mismatch endonuclease, patch repair protein